MIYSVVLKMKRQLVRHQGVLAVSALGPRDSLLLVRAPLAYLHVHVTSGINNTFCLAFFPPFFFLLHTYLVWVAAIMKAVHHRLVPALHFAAELFVQRLSGH